MIDAGGADREARVTPRTGQAAPPSRFAQFVLQRMLSRRPRRFRDRIVDAAWRRVRAAAVRLLGDPSIRYMFHGFELELPLSHDLPLLRRDHPGYATNLARAASLVLDRYPDLHCIDVGANAGDTAAMLRESGRFPILCIDGDPGYFEMLCRNVSGLDEVLCACALLGERDDWIGGALAASRGSAQLASSGGTADLRVRSLDSLLAEYPTFRSAKLLKIDTDGHDLRILAGAARLLAESKPVLFFEFDPHWLRRAGDDPARLRPMLREHGYRTVLAWDNFGDLLTTLDTGEPRGWEEACGYIEGREGLYYFDLCAFHPEDQDLGARLRANELARGASRGREA
jgi:FkbM family methyltransferase